MSVEVVGKIMAIASDEERGGYVVQFWVGRELNDRPTLNEAFALLGSMDSLDRKVYTMHVLWEGEQFAMEPDEDLAACLEIYDAHDGIADLESPFDRQWKTAQIADAIVSHLIEGNVFGVWRTSLVTDDAYEGSDEEE